MSRNKITTLLLVFSFCFFSMKSSEYIKSLCRNNHSLMPGKTMLLNIDSLTQFYTVENADIDSLQAIDMLSSFHKDSISLYLDTEENKMLLTQHGY